MTKQELEFRKERLVELQSDVGFYEEEVERLKEDILSSKTFKNDKRYVNFMSVLTNLTSMISNYKSQEFSMKQEIQIEQDKLEDQKESETKENK